MGLQVNGAKLALQDRDRTDLRSKRFRRDAAIGKGAIEAPLRLHNLPANR